VHEKYATKAEAIKREKNLKGAKGRNEIWNRIHSEANG
jgi:predicted GIY-YIG superfamily endonuclease